MNRAKNSPKYCMLRKYLNMKDWKETHLFQKTSQCVKASWKEK